MSYLTGKLKSENKVTDERLRELILQTSNNISCSVPHHSDKKKSNDVYEYIKLENGREYLVTNSKPSWWPENVKFENQVPQFEPVWWKRDEPYPALKRTVQKEIGNNLNKKKEKEEEEEENDYEDDYDNEEEYENDEDDVEYNEDEKKKVGTKTQKNGEVKESKNGTYKELNDLDDEDYDNLEEYKKDEEDEDRELDGKDNDDGEDEDEDDKNVKNGVDKKQKNDDVKDSKNKKEEIPVEDDLIVTNGVNKDSTEKVGYHLGRNNVRRWYHSDPLWLRAIKRSLRRLRKPRRYRRRPRYPLVGGKTCKGDVGKTFVLVDERPSWFPYTVPFRGSLSLETPDWWDDKDGDYQKLVSEYHNKPLHNNKNAKKPRTVLVIDLTVENGEVYINGKKEDIFTLEAGVNDLVIRGFNIPEKNAFTMLQHKGEDFVVYTNDDVKYMNMTGNFSFYLDGKSLPSVIEMNFGSDIKKRLVFE